MMMTNCTLIEVDAGTNPGAVGRQSLIRRREMSAIPVGVGGAYFEDEVERWFERRRSKLAGRESVADGEDYSSAPLSDERLWYMILHAEGCTLTWTTRDGAATASWITPAIIDGGIYFPTAESRAKTAGLRRDPRCALVFARGGRWSATARGRAEFMHDERWVTRWCLATAMHRGMDEEATAQFMHRSDSANVLVVRFHPQKFISFDATKIVWD
jgi:hypothetical protein